MDPSDIIETPLPLPLLFQFVTFSLGWTLVVTSASLFLVKDPSYPLSPRQRQITPTSKSSMLHVPLMIGLATIVFHGLIILCGVHPTEYPLHSLISALYLAYNILLPAIIIPGSMKSSTFLDTPLPEQQRNSVINEVRLKLKNASNYLVGPLLSDRYQGSTIKPSSTQKMHPTTPIQCEQPQTRRLHQYATLGTAIGVTACAILRILDHGMQIQRYPMPIILGATWGRCGGVMLEAVLGMLAR